MLRGWFRPDALDDEVAEELRYHLERQIQLNIEAGMTAEEARRAACLTVGSVESIREESRAARPGALLHQIARDVWFGVRLLRRAPGLAITAIVVIALGVGASTAIFSVVYGVVLRPLPYPDQDRLVGLWTVLPNASSRVRVHPADHRDWRASNTVFEDIALAWPTENFNLTGSGEPERLFAAQLSSNLFRVLGVSPSLGRAFREDEDEIGADRVVILGDALWRSRFGADPSTVGRTIMLSGAPYEVVGVMGPDFQFPARQHQLWVPLTINPRRLTRQASGYDHIAVARLKPGVRLDLAQREMDAIAARLATDYPATNRGVRVDVLPLIEESVRTVKPALYAMLAAVSCLLLVAALNLAGLLGARAAGRAREFAVRLALGASRGRLVVQALAEVTPMLILGGAAGIAWARMAVAAFIPIAPAALPRIERIEVNGAVLAFSLGVLILTGLAAGILPVIHAWRSNVPAAARDRRGSTATRDQMRTRSVLVVAQFALTLPLLVGATALTRSFAALMAVDPGFRAENVLTMHMAIARSWDRGDAQIAAFYTRLVDRLATIPGVESAGMVNRLPLSGNDQALTFAFEGVTGDPVSLQSRSVTPDYFRTMRIAVREGRSFNDRDTAQAPRVAVIDERAARALWPGERAIGKRYRVSLPGEQMTWGEIVGVVGSIRHRGLSSGDDRQIYFSHQQFTDGRIALVVRARDDVRAIAPAVRAAIHELDPAQPVYDVRPLDDVVARATAPPRLIMAIVTVFALSSLLLAGVGLYGVIAYGVSQRVREFGVRLALGAGRSDVTRLVLRTGVTLLAYGAALGLVGAIVLMMGMERLLFGVAPLDPMVFASSAGVLVGVALLASYLPGRRAGLTEPSTALRAE